ncbi:phosphoribosyltransferase family protein [Vibrio olivae]
MHSKAMSRNLFSSMLTNWRRKAMLSTLASCIPRWCEICRLAIDPTDNHQPICQYCQRYFLTQPRCARCGLPTLQSVAMCGQCLRHPPPWQRVVCVGDYQPPLAAFVQQLKYQRQFWLAPWLAQLLAVRVDHPPPIITCVPLHWRRHWWRGFNQSELLAMHLAQQLDCQFEPRLFRRQKHTLPQQGMNKAQRKRNLRHAFTIDKPPSYPHVAIVDDVMTTGSTVYHLSQLLLASGVKSIDIYCLCRTPEPKD